jgi:hypothetical protein
MAVGAVAAADGQVRGGPLPPRALMPYKARRTNRVPRATMRGPGRRGRRADTSASLETPCAPITGRRRRSEPGLPSTFSTRCSTSNARSPSAPPDDQGTRATLCPHKPPCITAPPAQRSSRSGHPGEGEATDPRPDPARPQHSATRKGSARRSHRYPDRMTRQSLPRNPLRACPSSPYDVDRASGVADNPRRVRPEQIIR